jgi:hypothetical protein
VSLLVRNAMASADCGDKWYGDCPLRGHHDKGYLAGNEYSGVWVVMDIPDMKRRDSSSQILDMDEESYSH